MDAELFGIGAKTDDSFTCKINPELILNFCNFNIVSGSLSSEAATTVGTTSTTAVACVATGTLAPSQGVKVTGTYQTGSGNFDYVSTVTIYLVDGSSFSYSEKGTLTNVAYNECFTSITEDDDPNAPNSSGLSIITGGSSVTATSAPPSSAATQAVTSTAPPTQTSGVTSAQQSSSVTQDISSSFQTQSYSGTSVALTSSLSSYS